ncbi:hypothetical protein CRUP_036489 [Coryphaenoides rupestris]|nr:hypothetical protein CRUP_036489 [Coryphaenoides rupestris]
MFQTRDGLACSGTGGAEETKEQEEDEVLLGSALLLFIYSNWQMDVAHGPQNSASTSDPVTPIENPETPARPTEAPGPRGAPGRRPLPIDNTSSIAAVSEAVHRFFPHNGAYWSRLLYASLHRHAHLGPAPGLTPAPVEAWAACREADRERLKTNVHDFDAYPDMHKDFLRGLHCRRPPQLIDQPHKCIADGEGTFLLLAVKSLPASFQRRQVVRETWGREGMYPGGLRVRTIFLLGSGSEEEEPDLGPLLAFEAQHQGDVLQWDFRESLFNLTLKVHTFLAWSHAHCRDAAFVFSGDDDVFVNTPAVVAYLQTLGPDAARQLYLGEVIKLATPIRDRTSKYYIPASFYEGAYPPYAGGGGYLVSGALLGHLLRASALIPLFPIDDVYVAMCAQAMGVAPQAHRGFRTFDVAEGDRENVCVHKDLMVIHQRSPSETSLNIRSGCGFWRRSAFSKASMTRWRDAFLQARSSSSPHQPRAAM